MWSKKFREDCFFAKLCAFVPLCSILLSPVGCARKAVIPDRDSTDGMILIPAGEFIFGSNVGDADEGPQRTERTKAYYIDKYEVTNEEFQKFKPDFRFARKKKKFPAEVTEYQAAAYALWAGKRLPTEIEWEKAARGTDGRLFPWGNSFDWGFVNWDEKDKPGSAEAHPASPYGCYDMAGAAWEWTSNFYQPYPGNTTPSESYGEKFKVIRGGGTFNDISIMRTSERYYLDPGTRGHYYVGFRCVKDAK